MAWDPNSMQPTPDLGVVHEGVMEGRRTIVNVGKYILMASSANFGNIFSMVLAGLVLPFLPLCCLNHRVPVVFENSADGRYAHQGGEAVNLVAYVFPVNSTTMDSIKISGCEDRISDIEFSYYRPS